MSRFAVGKTITACGRKFVVYLGSVFRNIMLGLLRVLGFTPMLGCCVVGLVRVLEWARMACVLDV